MEGYFTKQVDMNEYNFYRILEGDDITPEIIATDVTTIIMNKYETTVGEYLANNDPSREEEEIITRKCKLLVQKLHDKGILHGDLHDDNIVCDEDLEEFRIIDLENATFIQLIDDRYIMYYNDHWETEFTTAEEIVEHELNHSWAGQLE